ncbi:hypothetical protein E3N88_22549 [Mikania micrantha]|uniref:Uncharacterized protein n=1 Tax=Mikania micrantha TaxID=192012 RepID=A0A5N6NDB1_9ASTR|nr:hypothetical protein E3N88_22549 [Mikania micrantha]
MPSGMIKADDRKLCPPSSWLLKVNAIPRVRSTNIGTPRLVDIDIRDKAHGFAFGCLGENFSRRSPILRLLQPEHALLWSFHVLHSLQSPKGVGDIRDELELMSQESLLFTTGVGFS